MILSGRDLLVIVIEGLTACAGNDGLVHRMGRHSGGLVDSNGHDLSEDGTSLTISEPQGMNR